MNKIKSLKFEIRIIKIFENDSIDEIISKNIIDENIMTFDGNVCFLNKKWDCFIFEDGLQMFSDEYRIELDFNEILKTFLNGILRKKCNRNYVAVATLIPIEQIFYENYNKIEFKSFKKEIMKVENENQDKSLNEILEIIGVSEETRKKLQIEKIDLDLLKKIKENDIYYNILREIGLKYGEILKLNEYIQ
jgi:hypothetical protein